MVGFIECKQPTNGFLRSQKNFRFICGFYHEGIHLLHGNFRRRGCTIVVCLFVTNALSLSFLIFHLKNPAIRLDMPGLLAVVACVGVTGLAPIPRGTQASGGASVAVVPITSFLNRVGFT